MFRVKMSPIQLKKYAMFVPATRSERAPEKKRFSLKTTQFKQTCVCQLAQKEGQPLFNRGPRNFFLKDKQKTEVEV